MLIKSVEIQGFKSFADKTKLRFSNGLTAVVGPNGSGKSNISDAVRWVLGEQSTKQLRGQSMEDVIFSGTEKRKGHGFCEVTITFDNSDRTLSFDDDNVAVTRRYYRSHESEYLINGNFVRLKDVHELFMDTGLGRDGYSMIGQGKIDNIVSSKSDERRDIFEEASGISRYRYRKEESERKLNLAEENLLRLRDIESELKGRIEPLKQQSEAATEFLALSDEKKELEIGVWLNTLENSKEKFRNHENKIATATAQYAELEKQFNDTENCIDKNSSLFAALTEKIDSLRTESSGTEGKVATLLGEINLLNAEQSHNNENIERLENEKTAILTDSETGEKSIEEKKTAIKEIEAKKEELENREAMLTAELSALLSENAVNVKSREELQERLNLIAVRLSELNATNAINETTIGALSATIADIETKIAEAKADIKEKENESKLLATDLDRANEEVESSTNSRKGYLLRKESKEAAAKEANEKLETAKREHDDMLRRAEMLKELDKNMDGFSYAVKAVTTAMDEHKLTGICGAVGKLIEVDAKYAVAIEVALGAAAGHIIVNADGDAKRAIKYLKDNKMGRATFLPIGSLKPTLFSETEVKNEDGFIGMADELIKVENKYKSVFKWLLGRTVICDTLDSAARIAKKFSFHFKTVSLDGQVVNPGGSMTGGSVSRTAGTISRKDDIEKIKNKAASKFLEIKELEEKAEAANGALAKVNAEILNAESAIITANEDKIRVLGEMKRVEDLLLGAKSGLSALESDLERNKENLKALKTTFAANSAEAVKLTTEKDLLNVSSEGEKDETDTRRETISDELTEIKLKIGEAAKDIEVINGYIEDISLGTKEKADKVFAIENEIDTYKEKNKEITAKISALNENIEATKLEGSNLLGQGEELVAERNKLEQNSKELRDAEKQINADKEKISGEIARLNERKEVMMAELEAIVSKLYDEYELTRSEAEALDIHIENIGEAKKRLGEIKSRIKALGSVNVAAIEEYKEVKDRYEFLSAQIADVEKSKAELNKLIKELTEQMETIFRDGFSRINENFKRVFTKMFGGGEGSLKLTDPDNVLTSGIEIDAKLPGKNVPSLVGLSGGEKALIAISIYFAIMEVNAPPFCFLDEVETALDEINVDRFARYMKGSDLPTQFICITHRRGTMESADMLYGVTMQEKGVTKLIELDVNELEKQLKTLKVDE